MIEIMPDGITAVNDKGDVVPAADYLEPQNASSETEELAEQDACQMRQHDMINKILADEEFDLAQMVRDDIITEEEALELADVIAAYQVAEEFNEASKKRGIHKKSREGLQQRSLRASKIGDKVLSHVLGVDMRDGSTVVPVSLHNKLRNYRIKLSETTEGNSSQPTHRPDDYRERAAGRYLEEREDA